jgi:hypothetical protein
MMMDDNYNLFEDETTEQMHRRIGPGKAVGFRGDGE